MGGRDRSRRRSPRSDRSPDRRSWQSGLCRCRSMCPCQIAGPCCKCPRAAYRCRSRRCGRPPPAWRTPWSRSPHPGDSDPAGQGSSWNTPLSRRWQPGYSTSSVWWWAHSCEGCDTPHCTSSQSRVTASSCPQNCSWARAQPQPSGGRRAGGRGEGGWLTLSRGWQGAVLLRDLLMWEPVQVTRDIGMASRVEDGQEGEPGDW